MPAPPRHAGAFPPDAVHVIPSATIRGRDPLSLARTGSVLGYGVLKAWLMLPRLKPGVVVGFGGYPTIPPLLAATLRGIPTLIHEQNAVMGRANRMLAPRVRAIATGFRRRARHATRRWPPRRRTPAIRCGRR